MKCSKSIDIQSTNAHMHTRTHSQTTKTHPHTHTHTHTHTHVPKWIERATLVIRVGSMGLARLMGSFRRSFERETENRPKTREPKGTETSTRGERRKKDGKKAKRQNFARGGAKDGQTKYRFLRESSRSTRPRCRWFVRPQWPHIDPFNGTNKQLVRKTLALFLCGPRCNHTMPTE